MKTTLFTGLFVLGSLFNHAQTFKLTKGQEFEVKGDWANNALEPDSTGFYYFRSIGGYSSSKYVLHKCDLKTAATIYQKDLDLSGSAYIGGKGYRVKQCNKNGKIMIFSNAIKGKENDLLLQEFSSATGEPLGEPSVLDHLEDTKSYMISGAELNYFIEFTPDNKKMMVVTEIKQEKKEQIVLAKLYDLNGNKKIWEKNIVTTYSNSTVSSFDYKVNNEGIFSYLFMYLISRDYVDEHVGYGIGISQADEKYNKIFALPSEGITIYSPKLNVINGEFVCSGQFFDQKLVYRKSAKKNTGFFLITFDPLKAEIKTKSFDILNTDLDTKLDYKWMRDECETSDCKRYEHYKTLMFNNCFYQINVHHPYESGAEIIVYKYNKSNKLEWMKLIPRVATKYFGVSYLVTDKLNFIYREHPQNLEALNADDYNQKTYKETGNSKDAVLVFTGIDEKGTVTRKKIPTDTERYNPDLYNYDENIIKTLNGVVIPSEISKSQRRYNILTVTK